MASYDGARQSQTSQNAGMIHRGVRIDISDYNDDWPDLGLIIMRLGVRCSACELAPISSSSSSRRQVAGDDSNAAAAAATATASQCRQRLASRFKLHTHLQRNTATGFSRLSSNIMELRACNLKVTTIYRVAQKWHSFLVSLNFSKY